MSDDTTTTEATGHSPLPWTWGDKDYTIYDAGNAHVSIIEGDGLPLAVDNANGRFIVTAVNSVDRLTGERDWYRAGLHGISKGHYADPAEHAAGVLKWVGDDTPNPVDRLRETVAALFEAAENARDYVAGLDHIKGAVKCAVQIDAALALAAASHGDNDAAQKGPTE